MLSFVFNYGTEPLVLDQPEDDLDTALITNLIVPENRKSRWDRQVIIVTHNACKDLFHDRSGGRVGVEPVGAPAPAGVGLFQCGPASTSR